MDSLITAAARALATGDPLGALNRVALRDDAPALALRGIAMAQLGDLDRAKALVRRAARAFGPREAVARARCVVAEAEIALASRDLAWPTKALAAAAATLEAHGDRANAAHARYLEARRLLLIGRLDEAEHKLGAARSFGAARRRCAPSMSSRSPGSPCGASAPGRRRPRSPAPRKPRAGRAFRRSRPRSSRRSPCSTRRRRGSIARGEERPLLLEDVEALFASKALVIDACRNLVRERNTLVPLASASGAVRAGARARRGVARRRAAGRAARPRVRRQARRRIPSRAAAGRDRAAAPAAARRRPRERDQAGVRALAARRARGRRAGAAGRGGARGGARLPRRRRVVVELGAGARARREPAHGAARARRARRGGQGAGLRPRPGAALDDPAAARIRDDVVTPGAAARAAKMEHA